MKRNSIGKTVLCTALALVLALSLAGCSQQASSAAVPCDVGDRAVGVWYSDDTLMDVYLEDGALRADVQQGDPTVAVTYWSYDALTWDGAAGVMKAGNGRKCLGVAGDNGEFTADETCYTDGSATFALDGDTLVWTEKKEEGSVAFRHADPFPEDLMGKWFSAQNEELEFGIMDDVASVNIRGYDGRSLYYPFCCYDGASGTVVTMYSNAEVTWNDDDEVVAYDPVQSKATAYLDGDGCLVWQTDDGAIRRFSRLTGSEGVSDYRYAQPSPDWVAAMPQAQDPAVTQLLVVAGMGMDKSTANVTMHERDASGNWQQVLSTPAFVGKNGLCADEDHFEGCGQTPMGTYHFTIGFGIAEYPGCDLLYYHSDQYDYWSGDQREGQAYNELVDIRYFPDLDTEASEHIYDYVYEYQYALNISFNEEGTPGRGSAIFLHCMGPGKPYTGGCVAVPENVMRMIVRRVHEDCVVVIDTLEDLSGSPWLS